MVDKIVVPEEYELDDLLADAPSITVEVGKKSKTFWVRPPTEPEKSMSQNAARLKSRTLRTWLENPETEEHELLVKAEIDNSTIDEKRLIWLTANLFQKMFEVNRRSANDREDYFVPIPEGKDEGVIPPTNEDWDRYENEKRKQEGQRFQDMSDQQKVIFKELQSKAQEIPEEELVKIVEPLIIEQQVSREWQSQYGMQILIRCTFLDKEMTKRAFEGTEQALRLENSPGGRKVLDALLNAHSGLMLDLDRLKN